MPARELLINVDDIGIHLGAVDVAVETITTGVAASGSVMAVCPGSGSALELLAQRPDVPVGIHLVLIADMPRHPWSPLTTGASIQHDGYFLGVAQREVLLGRADAVEVRAEFRAQIEVVLEADIDPTHLDWHCLADGGRADIFDLTLELADEYGVGLRAWTDHGRETLRARGRRAQDQPFVDSFVAPVERRQEWVRDRIRALPPGLTEWAMHPARPTTSDPGSDVRVSDYRTLMALSTRQTLDEEGVTVLGWGDTGLR